MTQLIVGPALRYVGHAEATVWVEMDAPAEVEVRLEGAGPAVGRSFCVEGHHYSLVVVEGLEPGSEYPYEVAIDGETVWPRADDPFPACTIRTLPEAGAVKLIFGSCRVSVPHEKPYTLTKDEDPRGRERDALDAYARRMMGEDSERWPHVMLWLGDQIYADEVSPETKRFIESRRDTSQPPGDEVADYEEYTRLYWESWRDPSLRWLLSTVSSSMIWDDHDVHDDWNTSHSWLEDYRAKTWWERRIVGAITSYWVYQHLGNLPPSELEDDELFNSVCDCEDAGELLGDFARRADHSTDGTRWSYARDLAGTRLVVMDSRGGRELSPDKRRMLDDDEWKWVVEQTTGEFDNVLLGTSLPLLLTPALHHLEAWNEAVCEGAWGSLAARAGEKIRRGLDLEHWAAFNESFRELIDLVGAIAAGEHGRAPAAIVALSGDVHHNYLADVAFRRSRAALSAVYQAVCSPIRNPLDSHERKAIDVAATLPMGALAHALARSAGVPEPDIRWRLCEGPWFDNQISTLEIDGRSLVLRMERAVAGDGEEPALEGLLERRLA